MTGGWLTGCNRLLSDHGIPFLGSRYGDDGTSLFADQEKILQLARMLTHRSARSRDSEMFLVLAELCQPEYDLGPLINAIKLATARRHRVAVLCAWPPGYGVARRD